MTTAIHKLRGPGHATTEWGTPRATCETFGFGLTWLYEQLRNGRIESAIIQKPGTTRGKRLVNYNSVRKFLSDAVVKQSYDQSNESTY
jgi:hypothetical protein